MAKNKNIKNRKRALADHYAMKAKQEGYPARSVYKLEEIDQKMKIFKPGMKILDVGAAPGSWSIYVQRKLKGKGLLVAVDLKAMQLKESSTPSVIIKGDIYDQPVKDQILANGPYDVVISDAAPNTTGNRTVDAGRSYSLISEILEYSSQVLKQGGSFVIKVFQGGDEQAFFNTMREQFSEVKRLKPKAVRKESFETYFIGKGYNPPPSS